MTKLWDEVTRYLEERRAHAFRENLKEWVANNPDSEYVTTLPANAVVSSWGFPRELEPPRLPRLSVILGFKE